MYNRHMSIPENIDDKTRFEQALANTGFVEKAVCAMCKEEKRYHEFYKNELKKNGLSSYCKPCQREYARKAYRKRHPLDKTLEERQLIADEYIATEFVPIGPPDEDPLDIMRRMLNRIEES
jgi:hypothetical protein